MLNKAKGERSYRKWADAKEIPTKSSINMFVYSSLLEFSTHPTAGQRAMKLFQNSLKLILISERQHQEHAYCLLMHATERKEKVIAVSQWQIGYKESYIQVPREVVSELILESGICIILSKFSLHGGN